MVAMSSLLAADLDFETGLPQSAQKRTSATSAVPQKEQ
jgi:hypothetical protein